MPPCQKFCLNIAPENIHFLKHSMWNLYSKFIINATVVNYIVLQIICLFTGSNCPFMKDTLLGSLVTIFFM